MGKKTNIPWTDHTWNPWIGYTKVSPGCQNCYMYREMKRYGKNPNQVRKTKPKTFNAPLKWKEPPLVFVCSWSDFFHEEADQWRDEAWGVIEACPHLIFQILTKRPHRIIHNIPSLSQNLSKDYPNVWLGVSVEDDNWRWRIMPLLEVESSIRFISAEPLLGPLNLEMFLGPGKSDSTQPVDWVIAGGESGPAARPVELDWFRDLRDQCQEANVPFFLKQLGGTKLIDGVWGGNRLDGTVYYQMPAIAGI